MSSSKKASKSTTSTSSSGNKRDRSASSTLPKDGPAPQKKSARTAEEKAEAQRQRRARLAEWKKKKAAAKAPVSFSFGGGGSSSSGAAGTQVGAGPVGKVFTSFGFGGAAAATRTTTSPSPIGAIATTATSVPARVGKVKPLASPVPAFSMDDEDASAEEEGARQAVRKPALATAMAEIAAMRNLAPTPDGATPVMEQGGTDGAKQGGNKGTKAVNPAMAPAKKAKKGKKDVNAVAAGARAGADAATGGGDKDATPMEDVKEGDSDPLDAFMAGVQEEVAKLTEEDAAAAAAARKQGSRRKGRGGTREWSDDERYNAVAGSSEDESVPGADKRKNVLPVIDHATMDYPEFRRNFYVELPEVSRMTKREVRRLRHSMDELVVRGKTCPVPIQRFTQAGMSEGLMRVMNKQGYEKPTPIQAQALPALMSGLDVIGVAKTGSGKTLAFVLPMLRHVMDQPPSGDREGPIAVIMAPTRELVLQIHSEVRKFRKSTGVRCVAVYGGNDVAPQIAQLKRGADVVVCTPGRMIDVMSLSGGRILNMLRCTFFVLDEADRMFDMGFEPQITRIAANIRPDRQTCMFSATFPAKVEALARRTMKNPVLIKAGGRLQVSEHVSQFVEVRSEDTKFDRLVELVEQFSDLGSVLVFSDQQASVDDLWRRLVKAGHSAESLHGGKDQLDRTSAIADFRSGVFNVLVATSVAARGLDVPSIKLVVNYDMPNHIEDYVHRVGRTGRAGRKGTSFTFLDPSEEHYAPDLIKALRSTNSPVPPQLQALADSFEAKLRAGKEVFVPSSGYGGKGFTFDPAEAEARRRAERARFGVDDGGDDDDDDDDDVRVAGSVDPTADTEGDVFAALERAAIRKAKRGGDADGDGASGKGKRKKSKGGEASPASNKANERINVNGVSMSVSALKAAGVVASEATPQLDARSSALTQVLGGGAGRARVVDATAARKRAQDLVRAMEMAGKIEEERRQKAINDSRAAARRLAGDETFECELVINDFPQKARWKVTHKDALELVLDATDATVTTRGMYVPPGRAVMQGERKLYLHIEAATEVAVKAAKKEILRILKEATLGGAPEREAYGKYTVM